MYIILIVIKLSTGTFIIKFLNFPETEESYSLNIHPDNRTVVIKGINPVGVFYGIQSLLSLMQDSQDKRTLPKANIVDGPRFGYRGLMVDVARNFYTVDEIKRIISVMAMYKLNKLHLHLTDNEGWRIEIPALPELTQVGPNVSQPLGRAT